MNTRQLLSVGIDIGTTTTQVIFSRLELVNRAAVSQVPRYEFIKREISWQSPVFFTPVDKQGGLKEAELKALILAQYQAAGIAPETVDSGAIIITGESAKTRNARPAVMALSQSLGDFVVASAGPHLDCRSRCGGANPFRAEVVPRTEYRHRRRYVELRSVRCRKSQQIGLSECRRTATGNGRSGARGACASAGTNDCG